MNSGYFDESKSSDAIGKKTLIKRTPLLWRGAGGEVKPKGPLT